MSEIEWTEDALDWSSLPEQPMALFATWHDAAATTEPWDAGAMLLSTATKQGLPSSRIVLMRGFGEDGLRFFTNYESRKGKELEENPMVSVVFWWPSQVRQVRIEGAVQKLPRHESELYFAGRPRGSQIGAWCSRQSQVIEDLDEFQSRHDAVEKEYQGQEVPCPPHWGGYVIAPNRVEFWQGGKHRLHDRVLYTKEASDNEVNWKIERLSP